MKAHDYKLWSCHTVDISSALSHYFSLVLDSEFIDPRVEVGFPGGGISFAERQRHAHFGSGSGGDAGPIHQQLVVLVVVFVDEANLVAQVLRPFQIWRKGKRCLD